MTWVMWNLISFYLETVFASVPYGCTVCAERTIGSEIVLDAPDGTPRLHGSCGFSSSPFGDGVSVIAR